MKFFGFIFILSAFLFACHNKEPHTNESSAANTLFTLLDSQEVNINFVNEVTDQEKFNILTYRNFYNGGGVSIGDINNDSLPDIYFTANQRKK